MNGDETFSRFYSGRFRLIIYKTHNLMNKHKSRDPVAGSWEAREKSNWMHKIQRWWRWSYWIAIALVVALAVLLRILS
jgi:hypothetical protein